MSGYVDMTITADNFQRVQNKLRRFPKNVDDAMRRTLSEYFFQDFKPMLNKALRGFRARGVPARNTEPYATLKATYYRNHITHSLGLITGELHRGAMAVEPRIVTERNRTKLEADYSNVPESTYPYMEVVHEGLGNLRQAYPMVEAARRMTHKRLLRRLDDNVSQAWNRTGG